MRDPDRHSFGDWVVTSYGLLPDDKWRDVPESSRLMYGVQDWMGIVRLVQNAANANGARVADAILSGCEELGWCTAKPCSSVQDVLSCLCEAANGGLQSGQLGQYDTVRELLDGCHWVTHVYAAHRVLSQVLKQHAPVLLDNAQQQQQQQQRQ